MRVILIGYIFCCTTFLWSQQAYRLKFSENSEIRQFRKRPNDLFKDSLEALKYLRELKNSAIKKGFLLASIDSLHYRPKQLEASFHLGTKFSKAHLRMRKDQLSFVRRNGSITEKMLRQTPFRPAEVANLLRKVQQTYENNGYPFSSVVLDSIAIVDDELYALVLVKEQVRMNFSKINLVGNPLLSLRLVSSYTQIKEGDPFDQSKVNEISARIKQLGFVEEVKPAELLFTQKGVEIFLYLKAKPVSLINGVIGFQPDPVKGKLSLTGELRVKLVNVLHKAETFDFNWRSIRAQTQSLKILTTIPNLLQTPFGADGQFQLYKRDSSFLEIKATLGIQYALRSGNYLKAFYRRISSNVLAGGAGNPNFSNLKSVETNFYGLALNKQNLDYLPNPRRGVNLMVEATVGRRSSEDSNTTIVQNTFKGELQIQYYIPLAKRHVLRLSNFTEVYMAPSYFQNEVYRFGGQLSMRGFREEELGATARSVSTLEYRFLLDKNSNLFAFYDQAWYENKAGSSLLTDTPMGVGAGFTFGTNLGNFSISYAIGKQQGNPFLLREGKVHFGYITYF